MLNEKLDDVEDCRHVEDGDDIDMAGDEVCIYGNFL